MKKVLIIILVILLVAAAVVGGFWWYRNTHIFVDDAVYAKNAETLDLRGQDISVEHYLSVRNQLPGCEILWDVPFQGSKYPNDTVALTVTSLTEEDIAMLVYFPELKSVDGTGCQDYVQLEALKAQLPDCQVFYSVDLGAESAEPDTTELTLEPEDFDYATMMENLQYLPDVTYIKLAKTTLTLTQIAELTAAYPDIAVEYTVEVLGEEYDMETTELDLSAMTSEDVEHVAEKLVMLPGLTDVELMDDDGASELTIADVKALNDAAPEVTFHYTFTYFKTKISTTDEEVKIANKNIGEDGVEELRQVLDIMENCSRFVLDNCHISDETLAELREDDRDQTKIVWRVWFGEGSALTDIQVLRTTYNLTGTNCADLIYCEDVAYADLGHNESLTNVDFVAGMPNLEMIIVSGAPIKDLSPFENCKKLKILEIANCLYVEDVTPLAECTALEMLNISFTSVTDLSALDDLNLTHLTAVSNKVPDEEEARVEEKHPDCWIVWKNGGQPYGQGWRYDEEDKQLPWYSHIAEVFGYPEPLNNAGWYLKED